MDFWEIYDQHYLQVRNLILAFVRDEWVADDLMQEAFVRVQENLESVRDPSRLSSWIFRIAYNLCQDHFRNARKSFSNGPDIHEYAETSKEMPVQKELEQNQMGQCVRDQIDLLPESLRSVIVLVDTMDCSHREVADILGITVQNVKVRLHRARKKLKAILEEKCTFEVDERNVLVCEPLDSNQDPTVSCDPAINNTHEGVRCY